MRNRTSIRAHVVIVHVGRRIVREPGERALHRPKILIRRIDEDIDILGRADEAVKDNGETADQEVAGAFGVEGLAEADKVVDFRRAAGATI